MKVLIADDAPDIRAILKQLVGLEGAEVLEAEDGADAVNVFRASRPDLVLLDIDMPRMNGLDAARAIKRMDPQARLVMITANSDRAHVLEAFRIGVVDFIAKPFDPMRVWQVLQQHRGPVRQGAGAGVMTRR
jgi:two-component system chemotaxis response regulator CheY